MADPQPNQPARQPDWEAFYRDYRKPGYVKGFEITSKLGGGAFGMVFRARKESIGKDYAIKFLKVEDEEVRQAVVRELEQVEYFAQVDHPNLVQIEDRGEVDGIPYLLMQFAGTETLRSRLPEDGKVPSPAERDELLRWFLQACRGVAALHARSLVHFDLKPANVFLKGPVARVGDYGLSKLVTHSRRSMTMGRGTPCYMAPEMLQRRGDHLSDIYSLGVMLYEVLCGVLPFTGDSQWEVLRKHENEEPDWPDHLSATERAVLQRALQKDPAARFDSVNDMIAALGAPSGTAAAAWADVQAGAAAPAGPMPPPLPSMPPPPPPMSPPPEAGPAAAGGRRDASDPYTGLREASREAYGHAREIAVEATGRVQQFVKGVSKSVRDGLQADPGVRKVREWRQARFRRRRERRQAGEAGTRRSLAVIITVCVFAALCIGFYAVLFGVGGMESRDSVGEMGREEERRRRQNESVSSSLGSSTGRSWPKGQPGRPVSGVDDFDRVVGQAHSPELSSEGRVSIAYSGDTRPEPMLFKSWRVPESLINVMPAGEPEWVRTFFTDPVRAANQLQSQLVWLASVAPWSANQREDRAVMPQFEFDDDKRFDADLDRLVNGSEYDHVVAQRLIAAAPRSLAAAAVRIGATKDKALQVADWPHVLETWRRLHRLLSEATGCSDIVLDEWSGSSMEEIRYLNRDLDRMWLWYLQTVASTQRSWVIYQRLRGL